MRMTAHNERRPSQDQESQPTHLIDRPPTDDGPGEDGLNLVVGLVLAALVGGELYYLVGGNAATVCLTSASTFGAYVVISGRKPGRPGTRKSRHRKRTRKVTTRLAFAALAIIGAIADTGRLLYNVQDQVQPVARPGASIPAELSVQPTLDWSGPVQIRHSVQFVIPLHAGYSRAFVTFNVQDARKEGGLCTPYTTLTVAVGPSNNTGGTVKLRPEDWITTVDVTGFTGTVPVQLTVGNTLSPDGNCPVQVSVPNVTLTNR
jgi:hypothetical protein